MKNIILMMLLLLVLPMAIMAQDVTFTATSASIEGFQNQTYQKAFDGDINTKWCGDAESTQGMVNVEFQASAPIYVNGYYFITGDEANADNSQNRNPESWILYAKVNESDTWTEISFVWDITPLPTTAQTKSKTFDVSDKTTRYQYFRLEILGIRKGYVFELSEFGLDYDYIKYNFNNTDKTASVANNPGVTGDLVIPETVTKDGVEYRVTRIGSKAFFGCSGLTSVSIPNTVTEIGIYAFRDCTILTSVTLPNTLTAIEESAFNNCGLTSITIPGSVARIEDRAFIGCDLKSIYCNAETPPYTLAAEYSNLFEVDCLDNTTLHVPDVSIQAYKKHVYWGNFRKITGISFARKYQTELKEYFTLLTSCETISSNMQSAMEECLAILEECADDAEATQALNETCKPTLISTYVSEKKSLLTAAMKGESNDYLNEVYDECIAEIDAAVATQEVSAVKQAIISGITAVTSVRILHKHVEK